MGFKSNKKLILQVDYGIDFKIYHLKRNWETLINRVSLDYYADINIKLPKKLNGTTNYILTKMHDDGTSYAEALQQAQQKGIAETNPLLDVSGMDSACKLLLLSNSLLQTEYTLEDVSIRGIENVSKQDIQTAKEKGKQIKLLARAYTDDDGKVQLEVQPYAVDPNHSLAIVIGTEKGITFYTDTMGSVSSIGGASNPRGAAAAALKDVINLYRKDRI